MSKQQFCSLSLTLQVISHYFYAVGIGFIAYADVIPFTLENDEGDYAIVKNSGEILDSRNCLFFLSWEDTQP